MVDWKRVAGTRRSRPVRAALAPTSVHDSPYADRTPNLVSSLGHYDLSTIQHAFLSLLSIQATEIHGARQVVDDLICMIMSYMCDLGETLFNGILEPLNDGDHASLINNEP